MKKFAFHHALRATVLSLMSSVCCAELVWEQKEVHLKATPFEKELIARYPFKNEGAEPVRFKSFASACGCVSITASTMVVPPGASGDVTVKFRPEFRIGDQKRPIAVQFDDAKQSRMALYLRVEIPEVIRPQPVFLKWGPEESLEPKSVTIVTDEKYPVTEIITRTDHPLWETKITAIENSRNYSLQVLPKRGRAPEAQYVEVDAKLADGQVKRTKIYVVVR